MMLIRPEGKETITFGAMLAQVRSIAYRLSQERIDFGDRVALIGENHPNWAIAYLAILYRGAVVTRLDLSQVFEMYDVREMLEGLCVRLAVERTKAQSWQDLVRLFGKPMERLIADGRFEDYIANLQRLRSRTVEAAANSILADMLDSINDRTREIQRRIIILPGRAAEGLEQHRAVLAAMREGDALKAERLRRANIRSSREYLERFQSFVL